jgi:hypothetical protein
LEEPVNTNALAAAFIGFLLGGLTVSIAAELEDDGAPPPFHGSSSHEADRSSEPRMSHSRAAQVLPDEVSALPTTLVSLEDIRAAAARIRHTCVRTPVLDVPHPAGGAPLWLKVESLQRTGSFKLRGAVNAVAALGHEAKTSGLVT